MADTSIKISLELGAAAAQVSLGDLASKAAEVDKHIQSTGEHGSSAFAEITHHIAESTGAYAIFQGNLTANLAIKGIELLTDAAKELYALLITEGVQAASAQEDAVNRLNLALAGAGEYTGEASKDIQEFAEKLSNSTTVSKTAILQNAALLESFGRLSGEGLKDATKASVELASVLNIDLETATRLVGKAAEGNITSFKRYGLEVTAGATNSETFANALEAIAARGEVAEGKVNTFSGALKQNKNALEELQVAFGNSIVQNAVIVAGIQSATDTFKEFTGETNKGESALKTLVAEGFIGVVNGAVYVVTAFDSILRIADVMYQGLKVTFNLLGGALVEPFAYFSETAKIALQHFNEEATLAADGVRSALTKDTGLGEVATQLEIMSQKAQSAFDKLGSGASGSVAPINQAKKAAEELAVELTRDQVAAQKLAESLITSSVTVQSQYNQQLKDLENSLKSQEDKIKNSIKSREITTQTGFEAEKKASQEFFKARFALLDQAGSDEKDQLETAYDAQLIDDEQYNIARLQLAKNYSQDYKKVLADQASADKALNDQETTLNASKLKAVGDTFSNLGSLMRTKNKELFEIGKQASAAAAVINTFEAVTKTMAAVPYPFNIPLAAAQAIAGAVQVAGIESTQPAFANGGIVGGSSFSGDNITARVNSGEMVLNAGQQASLFQIANGNAGAGGASALASQVAQLGAAVAALASQQIVVAVDGSAIFNATRDQIRAGRTLA